MNARLLLHTCCGPCAAAVVPALEAEGFEVNLFFFNPNIHPVEEYKRRLDSFLSYAEKTGHGYSAHTLYTPQEFFSCIGDLNKRCGECFSLRLNETAQRGRERGYRFFSTTLTVSPYQDTGEILRRGNAGGKETNMIFVARDFRKLFSQTRDCTRELSLYRQTYCGCVFSRWEGVKKKRWKSLSGQKYS